MILQALSDYYDRARSIPNSALVPPGWQRIEIKYLLVIDQLGRFLRIEGTRVEGGNNSTRAGPGWQKFIVPAEKARSGTLSWKVPNLLWDHFGFVLGHPKGDSNADEVMAKRQQESFLGLVREVLANSPDSRELGAVEKFLSTETERAKVFLDERWPECAAINGCKLTFLVAGIGLAVESDAVAKWLSAGMELTKGDETALGICAVSGLPDELVRVHPKSPVNRRNPNAKLLSFQEGKGFDSFGKSQGYNAPVGKQTSLKFASAWAQLTAYDSRNRIELGDLTIIFWSDKATDFENWFAAFVGDDPDANIEAVRELYSAVKSGVYLRQDGDSSFFVLGAEAVNDARVAVRFWYCSRFSDLATGIAQHLADVNISCRDRENEPVGVSRLLQEVAPRGDLKRLRKSIYPQMFAAIITGRPYPAVLYESALRRVRVDREVSRINAGIIKAVINRARGMECISMSLDESNQSRAYILGRIFLLLEQIQQEALGSVGRTIRDTYWGTAMSAPERVFPLLIKLHISHLKKLARNRPGRSNNLRNYVARLVASLPLDEGGPFPKSLMSCDQGLFILGYFQQQQHSGTYKTEEPTNGHSIEV